jgi:hypothetical protein
MQNGKTMLNLTKFRQNFHPVWAKMMANLFRRGISEVFFLSTNAIACFNFGFGIAKVFKKMMSFWWTMSQRARVI